MNRVVEEMFETVEVDQVQVVDTCGLHAVEDCRRHEQILMVVLGPLRYVNAHLVVIRACFFLLVVAHPLECLQVRAPLLLVGAVPTACTSEA